MRICTLPATLAFIFAFTAGAMAQAAAEAALTHSLSSSMGSSVGKTMGRATNQFAGKLGKQTAEIVSRQKSSLPRVNNAKKTAAVPDATVPAKTSNDGSLIASIQGGEHPAYTCPPATEKSAMLKPDANASNSSVSPGCLQAKPDAQPSHPEYVTLPPAK